MKKFIFIFIFTLNVISFSATISVSSSETRLVSSELSATIYKPNITITRKYGESVNEVIKYKIWRINRSSKENFFSGDLYGAVYGTHNGHSLGSGISSQVLNSEVVLGQENTSGFQNTTISSWKDFIVNGVFFNKLSLPVKPSSMSDYEWYAKGSGNYVYKPDNFDVFINQRISIPWNQNELYRNSIPVMIYTWFDGVSSDVAGNLRIITIPKVEIEDIDFGKIYVNEQTDTISKTGNITISGNPGTNVNISILNMNFKLRKNNGAGEISAYAGVLIGLNNISARILETSIGNSGVLTSGLRIELENLFQVPEGVYQGDVTVNISFN